MSDNSELANRIANRRLTREDLASLASRQGRDELLELTLANGIPEVRLSTSQVSVDVVRAYVEGRAISVTEGGPRVEMAATQDAQISSTALQAYADGRSSDAEQEVIAGLAKVDSDFDEIVRGVLVVRDEVELAKDKVYSTPARRTTSLWIWLRICFELALLAVSLTLFLLSRKG